MARGWCFFSATVAVLCLTGCGGDSKQSTYPITGTASYDGTPIEDGFLLFVPEDKTLGPEQGKIKDGKFAFQAKGGGNKVEITGLRTSKTERGRDGRPAVKNYVPPRYNSQTILTAEVKRRGANHFEFALTSQK